MRLPACLRAIALLLATFGALPAAMSQQFPTKPVKLVVAFAAGGPVDLSARIVAEALTRKFGQPFVVENKTGANGAIAAEAVKTSPPDGHTILISNASMITITPTLVKSLRYNPDADFVPVTRIVQSPLILVINPENPQTAEVRDTAGLIALAKRAPGQLAYGSAGANGNVQQLAFELMAGQSGTKLLGVTYKGASEAQVALLGQQVSMLFDTPTAIPHIKAGKFRALAVATRERLAALPDVPTMAEAGFRDFEIGFWSGVLVPKGTPQAIVDQLSAAIAEACQDPGVRARLDPLGTVVTSSSAQFREHIRAETAMFADVIRRAGISVQ
jgi:tripartite-type tricarboxylate transporter receptor subunit TctC